MITPTGVHITIYFQCAYLLWKDRLRTKHSYALLAFISCVAILGTISLASMTIVNQDIFINYRNFPGGPAAFAAHDGHIPASLLAAWTSVIADWFTGCLLVSPCGLLSSREAQKLIHFNFSVMERLHNL